MGDTFKIDVLEVDRAQRRVRFELTVLDYLPDDPCVLLPRDAGFFLRALREIDVGRKGALGQQLPVEERQDDPWIDANAARFIVGSPTPVGSATWSQGTGGARVPGRRRRGEIRARDMRTRATRGVPTGVSLTARGAARRER